MDGHYRVENSRPPAEFRTRIRPNSRIRRIRSISAEFGVNFRYIRSFVARSRLLPSRRVPRPKSKSQPYGHTIFTFLTPFAWACVRSSAPTATAWHAPCVEPATCVACACNATAPAPATASGMSIAHLGFPLAWPLSAASRRLSAGARRDARAPRIDLRLIVLYRGLGGSGSACTTSVLALQS